MVLVYVMLTFVADGRKRIRHSGRLLGRPDPIKCSRRPRQLKEASSGHYYFVSETTNFKVSPKTIKKTTVIYQKYLKQTTRKKKSVSILGTAFRQSRL